MTRSFGRAAFLAVVSVVGISVFGASSSAAAPRPVVACFKPSNASLIGRLGPGDASVRYAFDAGACLALRPGTPVSDVTRQGDLWRFRTLGSSTPLYAPSWGAGFSDEASDERADAFGMYVPVSARLIEAGSGFAQCVEAGERLAARWRDLNKRWTDYQSYGSVGTPANSKVVLYYGPKGPMFAQEAWTLQKETSALDLRCSAFEAIEADNDFLAFVRSRTA